MKMTCEVGNITISTVLLPLMMYRKTKYETCLFDTKSNYSQVIDIYMDRTSAIKGHEKYVKMNEDKLKEYFR